MSKQKNIFLFYLILMITIAFQSVSYAQEKQNELELRLKKLEVLRQSGLFTEEELLVAKKKILENVTKPTATVFQIGGEYLVTFQELANNQHSMYDWITPGQRPFDEMSLGTMLWVIKQEGEQVNIDEYVYIENTAQDWLDFTKSGPTKQFIRKLPITKVVIDEQIARIRYSDRSRASDGSIRVDTTSFALRDNGNDGFLGEYERTIAFQGSSSGSFTGVSQGTISLVRNIEDTNSKGADLDF